MAYAVAPSGVGYEILVPSETKAGSTDADDESLRTSSWTPSVLDDADDGSVRRERSDGLVAGEPRTTTWVGETTRTGEIET